MSTITTLGTNDSGATSRSVIDTNFSNLNTDKVEKTGNETIAGIKTFSSSPIVPTPTTATQASNKDYVDTQAATKVGLTGNETVAGIKTFSSSPIVPTPTTDFQASTKKYVDDNIGGSSNASTTVKGIVEEADQTETTNGTATGGTGARLFVNPSTLKTAVASFLTPELTASATHSLTTVASEKVMVWAKGQIEYGGTAGDVTVTLAYNGVSKDVVVGETNTAVDSIPFSLFYTETPGAGTQNVTVTSTGASGASLTNVSIMVLKIKG